jgi:hypothetical protein
VVPPAAWWFSVGGVLVVEHVIHELFHLYRVEDVPTFLARHQNDEKVKISKL